MAVPVSNAGVVDGDVKGGDTAVAAADRGTEGKTRSRASEVPGGKAVQRPFAPVKVHDTGNGPRRKTISFPPGNPSNPVNWSTLKKTLIVLAGVLSQINSTLGSSLPSAATTTLSQSFNIHSQPQLVLPISLYLVGYVPGPVLFGPLSESYGRRIIIIVSTFTLFTLFMLASALAPNWPSLLFFRLLTGMNASSAISVTGGVYADIYDDPVTRGRAMALFMVTTIFGPLLGPVISGFLAPTAGWWWTFWAGLIIGRVRRAKSMRKSGQGGAWAAIELERKGWRQMATVTLVRPLKILFTEAVVGFSCLYLALAYAISYLFFEAYPIIFQGIYGMPPGIASLTFLPIGIGACLACALFLAYDVILQRAKARNASWAAIEEYRRLPLACLGGPCIVLSLFWLDWTSSQGSHWVVPTLAGILFGIGYVLIFMALLSSLTDAYAVFAASAMAASTCSRCLGGAILPFAATQMHERLGVAWASSLLGFLSLGMCAVPFIFIKYGDKIRARSKFRQKVAELKPRERVEEREGSVESDAKAEKV